MVTLKYPDGPKLKTRIYFDVQGQTLSNLCMADDLDSTREYPAGSKLGSEESYAKLFANVGTAIGAAARKGLQMFHLAYSWQNSASIRQRAVTELDVALEGRQLVVLDVGHWSGDKLLCPRLRDGKVCGSPLAGKAFADSATSSKGIGSVHTVYLACYTRTCPCCISKSGSPGKKLHDSLLIDQLPADVRAMLPVQRSAASGLPSDFVHLMLALVPDVPGCGGGGAA